VPAHEPNIENMKGFLVEAFFVLPGVIVKQIA
jgi:hypothetical protein